MGCMKLVGEAFKDTIYSPGDKLKTVVLGIANWHTVRGKSYLITNNVS